MKCPICSEEVRDFERDCPVCHHSCGYPNVRAAEKPEEVKALEERLRKAETEAAGRGCEPVLAAFRDAVRGSAAVLCRSLSITKSLVSSDSEMYASYYDLIGMGARRPEDTPIEIKRQLADDILFPHYREKIRFAALSLNGVGITRFGECSIVFKGAAVQERATVFEENSLHFAEKLDLGVRRHNVPPGFRAVWGRRDELAGAKLEHALQPDMAPDAFQSVILKEGGTSEEDSFIEVHIWGPLHRKGIARVTIAVPKGPSPRHRSDKAMLRELERLLKPIGVPVDMVER